MVLLNLQGYHDKVTFPSNYTQPMTEHGRNTKTGPFLPDMESFQWATFTQRLTSLAETVSALGGSDLM